MQKSRYKRIVDLSRSIDWYEDEIQNLKRVYHQLAQDDENINFLVEHSCSIKEWEQEHFFAPPAPKELPPEYENLEPFYMSFNGIEAMELINAMIVTLETQQQRLIDERERL